MGRPPGRLQSLHAGLYARDHPRAMRHNDVDRFSGYRVERLPDQRGLKTVTPEQLFETAHRSPQMAAVGAGRG
jgi:hypothetical protein